MTSPRHYRGVLGRALHAMQSAFGETTPDLVVVLGSGLGGLTDVLEKRKELPYEAIPEFPQPTVPGHVGQCVVGTIGARRILVFQGRFHFYEGHSPTTVTLPVRVAGLWGIRHLAVTNAAGSLRKEIAPGSLGLIRDHINLLGQNPLRGPNLDELGPRFFDMTGAYDETHRKRVQEIAKKSGDLLPEVVYAALPGPSYETPAEIRMVETFGADLVGMSTIPEVLAARHQGMRVMGISCITNYAAGILGSDAPPITHDEVLVETEKAKHRFVNLMTEWIKSHDRS